MLQLGITLFLACAIVCHSSNAVGSDTVVVELQSGQRLRAHTITKDPQNPDRVLLSIGNEQIKIRRSVAWSRVNRLVAPAEMLTDLQVPENVKVIGATADRELNLGLSPELAEQNMAKLQGFLRVPPPQPVPDVPPSPSYFDGSEGPPIPFPLELSPCDVMPIIGVRYDPGVVVGVRNANPNLPPSTVNAVVEDPQPRELVVSARAFNRNGLADWNSLEVMVQGRTASGLPCRVRGSLKCSLWVRRAKLVRAYAETYFEEPRDIFLLGQWSQFLDGSETDANGVQKIVLALPPRSPDHNLSIGQFGLMTVDLDIPGQGRLATSTDAISLRQFGPNRSRSVTNFGSSLLPSESVSEGLNDAGNWPAPLSGLRPDSRRFTVQP